MVQSDFIHDGVSIKIRPAADADKVVVSFTDDITAYYKIKKAVIKDKGRWCNGISSMIMSYLNSNGVATHFLARLSDTDQLCLRANVIPMEVIVRNIIAGSLAKRLGLQVGSVPPRPIIDLCYKSDELGDPLINDSEAVAIGLVSDEDLSQIYAATGKINSLLKPLFERAGIHLVDFKIEFGRLPDGSLVLSDDITPDSARFWDIESGKCLDKDRFRHDNGEVGRAYFTVHQRLESLLGLPAVLNEADFARPSDCVVEI